ncbi:MAG: hypothetical protein JWL89_510 [Candidatus Saccharibacteria bacterium]|nr:hypothetical protein [Candidatus Saccharibacteria bacterium]
MTPLFSIFFGAGIAAFVYTKMGRRLGYGNQTNVWTVVIVSFVLSSIVFYTLFSFIPSN